MPHFMAIVPPGLENIAAKELKHYNKSLKPLGHEYKNINTIKGGVEFESSMEDGLFCNHFLKIPVRILYRWAQFGNVLRTNDIESGFQQLDWFEGLKGLKPEFHVSSFKSKMFHLQKLKQACEMSYRRVKISQNIEVIKNRTPQKVFVRISKNKMTVSLDTTGELLYKRGQGKVVNQAPLRENLACALLWYLKSEINQEFYLLDPMCGSGTFLIESQNLFKINTHRTYQYQLWNQSFNINCNILPASQSPVLKAFGIEIQKNTFENLKQNIAGLEHIQVLQADSTKLGKQDLQMDDQHPLVVLTNPPYEKRLHLSKTLNETLDLIQTQFKPEKMYYLYPLDQHKNKAPKITLRAGGLNLGLFEY